MNCQQARPLIAPYVDGELDAAGVLALESHVHDCSACAQVWRNAHPALPGHAAVAAKRWSRNLQAAGIAGRTETTAAIDHRGRES